MSKEVYSTRYEQGSKWVLGTESDREKIVGDLLDLAERILSTYSTIDRILLTCGTTKDSEIEYFFRQLLHIGPREYHLETLRERMTPLVEWRETVKAAMEVRHQVANSEKAILDTTMGMIELLNDAEAADKFVRAISKAALAPLIEGRKELDRKLFINPDAPTVSGLYEFGRDLWLFGRELFERGRRRIVDELKAGNDEQQAFAKELLALEEEIGSLYTEVMGFHNGAVLDPPLKAFLTGSIEKHRLEFEAKFPLDTDSLD